MLAQVVFTSASLGSDNAEFATLLIAGAIGIEAVSRGCAAAHFVELDPWVCRSVLEPNLEATGLAGASTVHAMVRPCHLQASCRWLRLPDAFDPFFPLELGSSDLLGSVVCMARTLRQQSVPGTT